MKKIVFLCLVAVMFIAGCSGMSAKEESVTKQILSKDGNFFVWQHLGRHYVLGSEMSNAKFAKSPNMPYARTILGAGPNGETVAFEIVKKDDAYTERLIETYNHTPFLLASKGDNYFVYKYNGRIYVIGSAKTNQKFQANPHLPLTKTLLGAGPNGETVIFEFDKNDPKATDRLIKTYQG